MIQGILLKRFKFDYSLRYAIIITMSAQGAMSRQIQKRNSNNEEEFRVQKEESH